MRFSLDNGEHVETVSKEWMKVPPILDEAGFEEDKKAK